VAPIALIALFLPRSDASTMPRSIKGGLQWHAGPAARLKCFHLLAVISAHRPRPGRHSCIRSHTPGTMSNARHLLLCCLALLATGELPALSNRSSAQHAQRLGA
jgi:hypothetical protein